MSESKSIENLKRFKKIPIYVVEEHNDALQFIYSAIGGKKLPLEGTTLLHLDAHPDMLIDRKLKGEEARAGRKVLQLLQIENWIVPAAAAGHIKRVVWIRPPWANQFADGSRFIHVGDHPVTGFLRVDSKENYYLSDALYSSQLVNKRKFMLTVAELSNRADCDIEQLSNQLAIDVPFVLDIDLDFFSTANPFLNIYESIGLYDLLEDIFRFDLLEKDDIEALELIMQSREQQLQELEDLFLHLEEHGNLTEYKGNKSEHYHKVFNLVPIIMQEAKRLGERPDWWAVFAGGCTRDQGGLPHHISTEDEIKQTIENCLKPFLERLPKPVLITLARSTDDGYCPPQQVELIQSHVLRILKEVYDSEEPVLHYLQRDAKE
ncbi:UPF0489 protein C5orf22 homolog [Colias croceus]|uniref:UPF0489 protein C5orf22 homolog n=1 Tax=Colias crocea TaxID=72248 RepID=UPI001E27F6AD|nr:UPF0489 protein C5orf22 homolog [Colias croceus]